MRSAGLRHADVGVYLEATVRNWLGLRVSAPSQVPTLPEHLARLLLRDEEHENDHRDLFGRWEFPYSENFHRGQLWTPEIDEWAAARRRELARETPLEPLWPDGYRFAMCLTHDVDMVSRQATPQQVARSLWLGLTARGYRNRHERLWAARAVARTVRFRLARAPSTAKTLQRCVAIEQEAGVTSSFFFAAYPEGRKSPYDCVYAFSDPCLFRGDRRRVGDAVRWIGDAGFDVGLHGSYHTAYDAEALTIEKAALEEAAQREVTTTRQHYLHWLAQITPRVQEQAGLRADSSLGFNRNVGFRAGTSLPFRLFDRASGSTVDLIEVPLVLQDGALLAEQGLALDPALTRRVVEQIVGAVADVGGVATILFHPHVLAGDDIADVYRWTIAFAQARGGWVTSLREIETWWRAREKALVTAVSRRDGRRQQDTAGIDDVTPRR